ncbi:hypothetical protein U7230_06640 [Carboxydochorda subterranea]|uniref:Uncharacterized protein n=1 Tax=Carboxydichorda subterranea TaxID=3109565 RepID=A0ABZ1C0S3_9FIRM|nr:hypothetical protein [Limnochorda sp. L945t]WRP18672.1 hypothetical protein U7230_06640 [Limnochorda sp. L945t]
MAFYVVRARPDPQRLAELRARLDSGAFVKLRPFGEALTASLEGARRDPQTGEAVWEEEDYCSPPLAMEREAVLDRYFTNMVAEPVKQGEGWARIAHLPSLWAQAPLRPEAPVSSGESLGLIMAEDAGLVCDWQTRNCG